MSGRAGPFAAAARLAGRGQDPAITFLLLLPLGLLHLSAARPAEGGAWSLIEAALQAIGPWASRALGAGLVLALFWSIGRIRTLGLAWRTGSLAAILEGALWGLALGPALRLATSVLPLQSRPLSLHGAHQELALAAGAGLYEELLFRALLLGGGILGLFLIARLLGWSDGVRPALVALAIALSSLLFSWAHRLGDPSALEPEVFAFRALAGLVFSGLFLLRGLAVAAWAHAGYDALFLLNS